MSVSSQCRACMTLLFLPRLLLSSTITSASPGQPLQCRGILSCQIALGAVYIPTVDSVVCCPCQSAKLHRCLCLLDVLDHRGTSMGL